MTRSQLLTARRFLAFLQPIMGHWYVQRRRSGESGAGGPDCVPWRRLHGPHWESQ
jgi:hypothetical protein